ncbi:hypothetical protein DN820_01730 [Stutzerimonas nosocomialis]|uniref:Uncharacterized protein n=1 Tax=Stutzerimonas nosocomialis TaxID=1056496 RepID=A0A5R9QIK0_9GAMM|nr:hypothetical protein [Stutzerimonas nosocomialis]TLX65059.1 hypothetical protein DN820_01730 [Stutzerimonas nosocomialis]
MADVKFYKVNTLPGALEPDALYFVANGAYAESYVTDGAGVAKSLGNSSMINALINQALANWGGGAASTLSIVADIAARDTLIEALDANAMILVVDASGDPTVEAGSALYAYADDTDTVYKIAEYESMDVVVQWSEIEGRPQSTPAQIDNAVSQAHSHANKAVLDELSDTGNELYYRGTRVGGGAEWDTTNW